MYGAYSAYCIHSRIMSINMNPQKHVTSSEMYEASKKNIAQHREEKALRYEYLQGDIDMDLKYQE